MMTPEYYYCCKYYSKNVFKGMDEEWFEFESLSSNLQFLYDEADLKIEKATGRKIKEVEEFIEKNKYSSKTRIYYKSQDKNKFHIERIENCNEKNKKRLKELKVFCQKSSFLNDFLKDYVQLKHIKQYQSKGLINMEFFYNHKAINYFLVLGKTEILKELSTINEDFTGRIINSMLNNIKAGNVRHNDFLQYAEEYKEILINVFDSTKIEKIISILPDFELKKPEECINDIYSEFLEATRHEEITDIELFKKTLCTALEKNLIVSAIVKDDVVPQKRKRM